MTLTDEMIVFMTACEAKGIDISNTSGKDILVEYYKSLGLKSTDTFSQWLHLVETKVFPAYASVTRAIRKARELTPRWQKPVAVVGAQIEDVKNEVGY